MTQASPGAATSPGAGATAAAETSPGTDATAGAEPAATPRTDQASGRTPISRRALLFGTGAAAGALGSSAIWAAVTQPGTANIPTSGEAAPGAAAGSAAGSAAETAAGSPVTAAGRHQAGIARPAVPQTHCLIAVGELDTNDLEASLRALGEQVLRLTDGSQAAQELLPEGAGDVTVTIGIGQRALAATAHADLESLLDLPVFRGDETLPADRLGGDILLNISASDPSVLEPVLASLTAVVRGYRMVWSDFGFRAPSSDDISRNPLGYHDGIIVPRGTSELDESVWIPDGPLAGGSISVVRRYALDTTGFRALSQPERDAVIGRQQGSGAPLSGGTRSDPVNLAAKSDGGEPLIPARAHARAAHPSFTGSGLMLRRSYAYRVSDSNHGMLFVCYQNEIETFSRTQLRLDDVDDLMTFSTPTATAAFAILPGMTNGVALGASLFS